MRNQLISLCALALLPLTAHAQIIFGKSAVYQDGALAGWVYVAPDQDPCNYVENWYLFEGYQFPTVRNGLDLTVVSTDLEPPRDAGAFLAEMEERYPNGRAIWSGSVETRDGCP